MSRTLITITGREVRLVPHPNAIATQAARVDHTWIYGAVNCSVHRYKMRITADEYRKEAFADSGRLLNYVETRYHRHGPLGLDEEP